MSPQLVLSERRHARPPLPRLLPRALAVQVRALTAHLRRVLTQGGGPGAEDRGSAAVWMITVTFAVVLVVGLVVDGSSRMNAIQAADHAAAEAARAGAQAVPQTVVQPRGVARSSSGAQAVAAANAYLAAAGVSGSVSVGGGGSLSVTTSVPWAPKFLSSVGVGSSVLEGRAEVSLVQSVESRPS